jgi:hypothetical protein
MYLIALVALSSARKVRQESTNAAGAGAADLHVLLGGAEGPLLQAGTGSGAPESPGGLGGCCACLKWGRGRERDTPITI